MRFFNDISGKALLYAIPLFLTPFVDKLNTMLFEGKWPSIQAVIACTLLGICAAAIGLRAFFDGSYERKKADSDNGTAFPSKTPPQPPA
jgi:hypothetical protein